MLKLARRTVPVESACGYTTHYDARTITALIEVGRVAKLVRSGRKPDGPVVRVMLLAMPGEIAHRSPQSTVVEIAPQTWCHRTSLYLFRSRA
jgi:hypothetical protein